MRRPLALGLARSIRAWRLTVLLYGVHLLFALAFGIPALALWQASLCTSVFSVRIPDEVDLSWAVDFYWANVSAVGLGLTAFGALLASMAVAYLLVAPVVSAAVLGALTDDDPRRLAFALWRGLRRNSGAYYHLTLLSLPAFALWALGPAAVIWTLRAAFGPLTTPRSELWITWARGAAMLTILVVARLAWDYARIAIALEGDRRAWPQLRRAMGLVLGRPGPVLALFFAVEAVTLLATLPLLWWAGHYRPGAPGLMLLPLLQQGVIFFRQWARVACYATEVELYRQLSSPLTDAAGTGNALPAA